MKNVKKFLEFLKRHKSFFIPFGILLFIVLSNVVYKLIPPSKNKLQTLQVINAFAQKFEEFPSIDNNDWLKPDYSSFYKEITPSNVNLIIRSLFPFLPTPEWTPYFFVYLLTQATKNNELVGRSGEFILKLSTSHNAKFVIWGVVQGAFHSLIRDLNKLKAMDIINDNLEIIAPEHYFVFNGDLINRSPFSLETLTLVLLLMHKNPNNVFYLRGNNEYEDHFEYGINQELTCKTQEFAGTTNVIPLKKELLNFFNTLPLALFLKTAQNDDSNFIRISHFSPQDKEILNENNFINFLKQPSKEIQKLNLNSVYDTVQKGHIQLNAIITCIDRSISLQPTNGLSLLPQEKGTIVWDVFSAPTSTYKILHDFFYDAFVIMSQNEKNNWIMTLYNQDVNTKIGFATTSFDLISGTQCVADKKGLKLEPQQPTSLPITKPQNDIIIGTMLGLSGSNQDTHSRLLEGMSIKIEKENAAGGIKGQKIKFVYCDHEYEVDHAMDAIKKLAEKDKIQFLLVPGGTTPLEVAMPTIEKHGIIVFGPNSGAMLFRKPELKNYFHFRTSYENETNALMGYALKKLKSQKFAFFYEDNSYGKDALTAALNILKINKIDLTQILQLPYIESTTAFSEQATLAIKFEPDTIILIASPYSAKSFLDKLGATWLTDKKILALSPVSNSEFIKNSSQKGYKIYYSQVVPNWNDTKIEIIDEYLKDISTNNIIADSYSLQSYIAASILIDTLNKLEPPITQEKFRQKIESFKNYNFKGIILNFDPNTRELTKQTWIEEPDGKWITPTTQAQLNLN